MVAITENRRNCDMADWKKLKRNIGRTAMEKTEELADMASLQIKLKTLDAKRKEQYAKLGKLTYRQIKSGESQAEKIAPIIDELDTLKEKLNALVAEIEAAKKEREAKKAAKKESEEK